MPDPGPFDQTTPPSQLPTVPPAEAARTIPPAPARLPAGTLVSRYRVESVLGEGGMGTVYLARQERPNRQVALKLIRPGYATERMLRRFEHEAEVLGRLLHPGIAQIYEAGTADSGAGPQPFFAMELVKGVPLTQYALDKSLGTRPRLELMAKVCDAVQHAHQKGVIHRDLKPGNILVAEDGQPKILDFGVARATDSDIQQTTVQTDIGALIGTIPYMSPEQVGGDPNELDTRSDVYALGVIAYQLLVGRLPYNLEKKMIHEAARIIREDEPTRLSSLDRALRGDIETIVAHALEKDKSRRYGAASGLAADIRRYLNQEPIAARPASTWYQLAKFSRRNKGLVAGVGAAFALLVAGVVATGLMLGRAIRAESGLKAQLAETDKARADEKERADETKQVADFHKSMLGQLDPTEAGLMLKKDLNDRLGAAVAMLNMTDAEKIALLEAFGDGLHRVNMTDAAREMIDRTILRPAVGAIDKEFKDQPVVDAQLRHVLAERYENLGLYQASLPLQERSLATRRRVLGEEHPDTLRSIIAMGSLLKDLGDVSEAEPYFREALEKMRRVLGEEHPDTIASINSLGSLLGAQGKVSEAEPYYREVLEKSRRVLGEDHLHTLGSINNMGALLKAQGRLSEAEPYFREALEKMRRVLGEEHQHTLSSIANLGVLLEDQGRLSEAEPYYREAMEKMRRLRGEEHPYTLTSINNMGQLLQAQGKVSEAEACYREVLEKSRRVLGEDHPNTLSTLHNMGHLLQAQGKVSESEPYCREALEKMRRVLGEEHPTTLLSIINMGSLLRSQGRLTEAEQYFREALEKTRRILGEDHPHTLISINNLGVLLNNQGRFSEAEPYCSEAMEKHRRVLGEEHPETLNAISNMGTLFWSQGKFSEAEPYYREVLEKFRRVLGEEHPRTLLSVSNLGTLLWSQGKFSEAEPLYREALEKRRRVLGDEHPDTLLSTANIGALLHAQGKRAEVIELLAAAEPAARRAFTGPDATRFARLLTILGRARAESGFDEAAFALAEANFLEAHPILASARGEQHKDTRECAQGLADLYQAWDAATPGKGYDTKGAEWKAKLDAGT